MKLVVQIPCYNEEATIARVLKEIPREIKGVDQVEVLLIDDGSTDETIKVAQQAGVDHIVQLPFNNGLAAAFRAGFEKCRELGADIVVNTDGDGQYPSYSIADLIAPILNGTADLVVGDRNPGKLEHFSFLKRQLQRMGSRVVSVLAKQPIADATSGFRAYSHDALFKLTIETDFSHSLESLIQASWKGLKVRFIPIEAQATERKSRLAPSKRHFILKSLSTMLRVVTYYRPLAFFGILGSLMMLVGSAPIFRFLWFFANGDGRGHIQSLVIGGTLSVAGFVCLLFGVLAVQINSSRRLIEESNERLRRLESKLYK